MVEASLWDTQEEHRKEAIRKADRQLVAADALAAKAEHLLNAIFKGGAHGDACVALDTALRKYKEASNA